MSVLSVHNSGPVPKSLFQKKRHNAIYGIMHLGLNTYTNKEWGYGDESPLLFDPENFDADKIVKACKEGGLSGIVLVCKHHDGFCLWPTKTTPHNIAASPWRKGKGDLVREMADACRANGLEIGFYVSPWDRNHPSYGKKEYLEVYREQLREIFTNYGQGFELWFDGANGGDGYYGGAREERRIDASTYYDWENTWKIARELQKDAAIFSDIGPELRWVGNECGFAHEESFGTYTPNPAKEGIEPAPGLTIGHEGMKGTPDGKYFIPFEADFPLRPGWFYHPEQEGKQRSVGTLVNIYLHSVGCGGFMNVGIAPDKTGVMTPGDCQRLKEFKKAIESLFEKKVFAENIAIKEKEGIVEFGREISFNFMEMQEEMIKGECIRSYTVSVRKNGKWEKLLSGEAVGFKRLKRVKNTFCDAIKISIEKTTEWNPEISTLFLGLYQAEEELLNSASGIPDLTNRKDYLKLSAPEIRGMEALWTLPEMKEIKGFIFTPIWPHSYGTPTHYKLERLDENNVWQKVCEGEFANIKANPIAQIIEFAPVKAIKLKMTALQTVYTVEEMTVQEMGILC